jgi:FkbM family methyltransferase
MKVKRLFYSLVPLNTSIYHLCRRYVDFYRGENNDDISTNGELRLMQQVLPQCHVVFDVGAHIGEWTSLALGINPRLSIHSFEPSEVTYERLVGRSFPASVVCNNFGLSSKAEERVLYLFEEGAGINSLYRRQGLESFGLTTQRHEETVALDTLDHYCQSWDIEGIDYLKLDVEGHELEVFKGASKMLEDERIRIIQFEYGGANIDARVFLKDMVGFLSEFGYAFHKIYPRRLEKIEHYDQTLENFQYQNWIAVADSGRHLFGD